MGTRLRVFELALPLVLIFIQTSIGEKCNCEGFFCISDNAFQLCVNGEVVGDPVPCVTGAICRNDTEKECSLQLMCQESDVCSSEGTFPDKTSESKYYTCVMDPNKLEWIKQEYTCPQGSYFSVETSSCVEWKRVSQRNEKSLEEKRPDDSGTVPSDADNARDAASDNRLGDVGQLCPSKGNFPDPENCRRFYSCNGVGIGTQMDCPVGTYYDAESTVCTEDVPERCGRSDNPATEVQPVTTSDPEGDGGAFACPGRGYFADPNDCRRYYQCDANNNSFPVDCPEGTYFHAEINDCTEDVPSTCKNRDATTPRSDGEEETTKSEGTTEDPATTTDGGNLKTSTNNVSPSTEAPSETTVTIDSTTITSNDEEVTRYPSEDGGTATSSSSAPDDPINEVSTRNPEDESETTDAEFQSTTPAEHEKNDSEFVCPGEGYFPDPTNCHLYYSCNGAGSAMPILCPNDTYYHEESVMCTQEIPKRCEDLNGTSEDGFTSTTAEPTFEEDDGATTSTAETPGTNGEESDRTTRPFSTTTPKSSFDDDTEFTCPGEGYYPDVSNCQNYYVCIKSGSEYISIPVVCPGSSYFDDASQLCTAEIPERCKYTTTTEDNRFTDSTAETTQRYTEEPTTPKDQNVDKFQCPGEGYYPDPANCQYYYVCFGSGTNYTSIPLVCPTNTYFDDESGFCTPKIPDRCKYSTTTEGGHFGDATTMTTQANTEVTETPTMGSTTPRDEEGGEGIDCPDQGYYPDPKNCSRYFMCYDSGMGIAMLCPENTFFDDRVGFCTPEMPERCRGSDGYSTTPRYTESPTTPKEEGFTCPGEGYYPDANNCRDYYICFDGIPGIPVTCPDNMYFDEGSNFCTEEMPDRCRATTRPTEDRTTETTPNGGENEVTSTTPSTPEYHEFVCPGNGYYPHPKNCHEYYLCYGFGTPVLITCPGGTYFDEKSAFCTSEMPDRCKVDPDKNSTQTQPPRQDDKFACPGEGEFADPKNCSRYWICYSKTFGFSVTCPRGTYYHEGKSFCSKEIPERCKTSGDFVCTGEGYFADPSDCQSYHVCFSGGISFAMRCPGNSYYDEKTESCSAEIPERCREPDAGDDFACPQAGYFPDPRDCSRYFVCNFWGDSFLAKCPKNRYFNEKIRGCSAELPERCKLYSNKPPQGTFACPGIGYFPDLENCNQYHVCSIWGKSYTGTCPKNTYYDEKIRACTPFMPKRCRMLDGKQNYVRTGAIMPLQGISEGPKRNEEDPATASIPDDTFMCPGRGLFPDPTDCHTFHVCYGYPRRVMCRGGLYYNDVTRQCTKDMPDRCKQREDNPNDNREELPTVTPTPGTDEFTCPGTGVYPDPTDCHRFYVCYGYPRLVTCRDGLYYNDITQLCDVNMPERCRIQDNTPNKDEEDRPTVTPAPGTEGFTCPGEGLFPDPTDCRRFYVCYGYPRLVRCHEESYYNDQTLQCEEDMPERCKRNEDTPNIDDQDIPMTTPPPANEDFTCPGTGIYPDPSDCHRFYVCYGYPRLVTCRNGLYYNDVTQLCDVNMPDRCRIQDNTPNEDDHTRPPVTPAPGTEGFTCPGEGLYPDPTDCRRFYVCYGYPRLVRCHEGSYYNDQTLQCEEDMPERCKRNEDDQDIPMTTPPPSKEDFTCPGTGVYPDPSDCHRFYVCYGYPRLVTCRDGLYYNDITQLCDVNIPERCRTQDDIPKKDEEDRPTVTPTPGTDEFTCPGIGIYADPADCHRLYVCYGYPRLATCRDGLYYNDITQLCDVNMPERCRIQDNTPNKDEEDRPTVTPTPGTEGFTCPGEGLYPDPTDCRRFYVCYGYPRLVRCHEGSYYNDQTLQCEEDMPERCKRNEDDQDLPMTTPPPAKEDFTCPGTGVYPDPSDCHRFYVCYGYPRLVTCRDGLYYNDLTQLCDVNIPERCRTQDTTPDNDEQYRPTVTPRPGTNEFTCPGTGIYPDPSDCHRFYVCYGYPRLVTCRNGLYYNDVTQLCDINMPKRCEAPNTTPDRGENDISTVPPTPGSDGFVCPGDGLFADPEDCSKFYVCYGQITHISCGQGTYFNEEEERCNSALPARCVGDRGTTREPDYTSTVTVPTTPSEIFKCQTPGRFPDPLDCRSYYVCSWQLEPFRFTCKDSTYFNDITKTCEAGIPDRCRSENGPFITTTSRIPSSFVCPDRGNFPDDEDCHKYYFCPDAGLEPYHYSCPKNQFYHQDKRKCKKIKDGSPCPARASDSSEDSEAESSMESDEDKDEDFVCKRPGLFPDMRDCKKFYECSWSLKPIHKTCSGNTYFNEVLNYCSFFTSERCRRESYFPW